MTRSMDATAGHTVMQAPERHEFPVVGVQVIVMMPESAYGDDIRAVMRAWTKASEAMRFTAAAVLPIGIDYRIEVVEL
jgi:hypothetical protein